MDIRSFVFAQQGKAPYSLFTLPGAFNCQVEEVYNSPNFPMYVTWFFPGDPAQVLNASYDILSVVPYNGQPYLRTVGGHILERPTPNDNWIIIDVEEYFMPDGSSGIPEFPIDMDEGAAVVQTSGTWKWHDNSGHTGIGTWANTTRYSLDKQRFMWDEEESEHHNDTDTDVPYHRMRLYDNLGWIGFNDVLIPSASVRRQDYL